jgi:hypothetical protein
LSEPEHVHEEVAAGRLVALLERICVEKRPCRFCRKTLYFVDVPREGGKRVAYNAAGNPHAGECPEVKRRDAERRGDQGAMFDNPTREAFG